MATGQVFTVKVNTAGLDRISAAMPERVAAGINNAVLAFVARADQNTPVDTGNMKRNKTIRPATAGNLSASVTYNQSYSPWVHNGTRRMAARPWAAQAMDEVRPVFESEMAQVFA